MEEMKIDDGGPAFPSAKSSAGVRGEALDDCSRMAARMYAELQQCRCECSVSVQPPHALKCARCRGLEEFDRHRSPASGESGDVAFNEGVEAAALIFEAAAKKHEKRRDAADRSGNDDRYEEESDKASNQWRLARQIRALKRKP